MTFRKMQYGVGVISWVALALAARAAPVPGPNLLPNPSFEAGDDTPAAWSTYAYAGALLRRDASVGHAGAASGLIEVTPLAARQFPCFNFAVQPVRAGDEYEASAWVRTRGVISSWGAYLTVEFFKGETRLPWVDGGFSGGGDRDWQLLTTRAIVPEGADRIMIALGLHAEGRAWFDDASLCRVGQHGIYQGDALELRVAKDPVITPAFLGFGAHADAYLWHSRLRRRGVDDADRALIRRRLEWMRPGLVVVFFNYQWWEPREGVQTPDSEEMRDLVEWLRLLQSVGTAVIFMPWGDNFAYSEWMLPDVATYPVRAGGGGPTASLAPKLPLPEKRQAVMRSLADVLGYLRQDQGLTNVGYVSIVCEPDNDDQRVTTAADYVALNRMLDLILRQRGRRADLRILGPEESSPPVTGMSTFGREAWGLGHDVLDGLTAHTYMHRDTRLLPPWIEARLAVLRATAPARPPKPFIIAEFGYGGGTYKNPENATYEYGLFLADFGLTAAAQGAAGALMWCLFDTYYGSASPDTEPKQEYGLWRFRDEQWAPRPGYYSWSLITRYARPGSRVLPVVAVPAAESVPAVAFLSPQGELTVLMVNRGPKAVGVTLATDRPEPHVFRLYEYSRQSLAAGPGESLPARPVSGAGTLRFEVPGEAFVLVTSMLEQDAGEQPPGKRVE